ncbi:FHA domain-containing protein [Baaleninema sp.]|uniref:FHA domain-containing protein n=1 Tax=Baaleninema sp. TaxID=3101197 RepID=UPI003D01080A
MTDLIPYLVIQSPTGTEQTLELRDISYDIGRLPSNHISLPEDPDSLITRIKHCTLNRKGGQWIISDNSTNGTSVELDGETINIHQRSIVLKSGAVILIHGWRITFNDPNATQKRHRKKKKSQPHPIYPKIQHSPLIYKISQATLYYQSGSQKKAIYCRPQVNRMLRYMAQRNLDNKGEPILCEYQALIEAIWEDEEGHISQKINSLAREIRKIFEKYSSKTDADKYLKTVRRLGYLLDLPCEW